MKVLFISMLGEREHFKPTQFVSLCPSGLERDWILDWHAPLAAQSGLQMSGVDVCRGERLPAFDQVAGVILGGTMHVVTEDRPWLHDLRKWLRAYRATERPLLAICGGHQMLCSQFGNGTLAGRSGGTLMGTYEIQLTAAGASHPLFCGIPSTPQFHFANYLHIIPAAEQESGVLAVQDNGPAVTVDHGDNWFSCQFHPESRKESWDIYYGAVDPQYTSGYSEEHYGAQVMANFFELSSRDQEAKKKLPSWVKIARRANGGYPG